MRSCQHAKPRTLIPTLTLDPEPYLLRLQTLDEDSKQIGIAQVGLHDGAGALDKEPERARRDSALRGRALILTSMRGSSRRHHQGRVSSEGGGTSR